MLKAGFIDNRRCVENVHKFKEYSQIAKGWAVLWFYLKLLIATLCVIP
jgi:hypothetical protein